MINRKVTSGREEDILVKDLLSGFKNTQALSVRELEVDQTEDFSRIFCTSSILVSSVLFKNGRTVSIREGKGFGVLEIVKEVSEP